MTAILVKPGHSIDLAAIDPAATAPFRRKADARAETAADLARLRALQERLSVDGRHAVLLVLQGMDTSGKDGMIRHLSGGVNLLGVSVTGFRAPTEEERRHDFLWRVHQRTPALGQLAIFNRSHYEDVLVARVHELVPSAVWERRYGQINDFEALLTSSGTTLLKCFLHISKAEQKRRLQARLDDPAKLGKFDPHDLVERDRWDQYQAAYQDALDRCSPPEAPWHVIPADKKWSRNYAVTRLLVQTLERLDLQLPEPRLDPKGVDIP